jgi:hypothetical protein
MDRDRKAGILLLLAAAAFLVGAVLNDPRRPLNFVGAAAFLLAGLLKLRKSSQR